MNRTNLTKWAHRIALLVLPMLLIEGVLKGQCTTYSILSTGFNRSTQSPYSTSGGFDSYWEVISRQDLGSPPNYLPVGGTIVNYASGTLPYVVSPGPANIGNARHISLNPTSGSVYQTRNMVTYRTYFTLPNPLPTNLSYSLSLALRADDGVYLVKLNGTNLKTPTFANTTGGAYGGPQMDLSAYSFFTPGAFLPGSNYIDITIGDLGLSAFFFQADIILYTCNIPPPPPPQCYDCISSFAPIPGKKYLVSAWAKEKNAAQSKTSYTFPNIQVLYPSIAGSAGPFLPTGDIIDGWQRIEGEFLIPNNATDISLKFNCTGTGSNDCYYDDVRVVPFDGSMKSFVYDPVNLRLVAELDERNYSTLYEYDEEGKLIRVKKETERGKMTIKENRDNTQQ